jgi:2-polyprenyl-3-methyl-5-hydroxy-6-metoxy-1,4-benzoquinol methylase
MTTTETEQSIDGVETAIEEQMGRLTSDLSSSLAMLTISLGTRSGLWAALAGAGPLTAEQAAAGTAVAPALVREWLRAQAASGYLDYDAAQDTYTLPDPVAAVLVDGPGGQMVEACMSMFVSMAEGFDDFSKAFAAGKGFGWHQRSAEHWHGTDALTRVALPGELIAAAIAQLPGISDALNAGGAVLDVGCGYGSPTRAIAKQYPAADVLGADYHDASIMWARETAALDRVQSVRFEVAPATGVPHRDGGYHLITFFDSLHDMGDPRGALARAREVLAPDGAVLLVEPLGADTVADNLNPLGRMFYSISVLACTPNAVSQRTATSSEPLGAQAGEAALRALAAEAGFHTVRRVEVPAPINLVLELRP